MPFELFRRLGSRRATYTPLYILLKTIIINELTETSLAAGFPRANKQTIPPIISRGPSSNP